MDRKHAHHLIKTSIHLKYKFLNFHHPWKFTHDFTDTVLNYPEQNYLPAKMYEIIKCSPIASPHSFMDKSIYTTDEPCVPPKHLFLFEFKETLKDINLFKIELNDLFDSKNVIRRDDPMFEQPLNLNDYTQLNEHTYIFPPITKFENRTPLNTMINILKKDGKSNLTYLLTLLKQEVIERYEWVKHYGDTFFDTKVFASILKYIPGRGIHRHADNVGHDFEGPIWSLNIQYDDNKLYYDMFPVIAVGYTPLRIEIPIGDILCIDGSSRIEWFHSIPDHIPFTQKFTILLRFKTIDTQHKTFSHRNTLLKNDIYYTNFGDSLSSVGTAPCSRNNFTRRGSPALDA